MQREVSLSRARVKTRDNQPSHLLVPASARSLSSEAVVFENKCEGVAAVAVVLGAWELQRCHQWPVDWWRPSGQHTNFEAPNSGPLVNLEIHSSKSFRLTSRNGKEEGVYELERLSRWGNQE